MAAKWRPAESRPSCGPPIALPAHTVAPPGARDNKAVKLRFTYDVNGLLQVDVTPLNGGESMVLVIEGNPGMMSPQEIAERL